MTLQPIPEPEFPATLAVTVDGNDRLASLHAQYADAKAEADAAAERLKTITDGIKAELRARKEQAAPTAGRIELSSPYGPTLRLVRSERVTFDSKRLKADAANNTQLAELYVHYARFGEAWTLRAVTDGGEG